MPNNKTRYLFELQIFDRTLAWIKTPFLLAYFDIYVVIISKWVLNNWFMSILFPSIY